MSMLQRAGRLTEKRSPFKTSLSEFYLSYYVAPIPSPASSLPFSRLPTEVAPRVYTISPNVASASAAIYLYRVCPPRIPNEKHSLSFQTSPGTTLASRQGRSGQDDRPDGMTSTDRRSLSAWAATASPRPRNIPRGSTVGQPETNRPRMSHPHPMFPED